MSTDAVSPGGQQLNDFEQLRFGREVIRTEAAALVRLADQLDSKFCEAVELLYRCQGSVIVSGMGKAGLIGRKIAATLASTGTTSHFLHPGEAVHGDLGRIHRHDVVLALSASGETDEVVRLLPMLRELQTPVVAITGNRAGTLARHSRVALWIGRLREACSLGLAPSTSTTAMLALGDALALVLSRMHRFGHADFARFHPGGSLGRRLAKVEDVMRPLADCRLAPQAQTVRDVLVSASRPGRRPGAIMLVDEQGSLAGIFTDSDLARLLEAKQDSALDQPVGCVMTASPKTVAVGERLDEAVALLAGCKISELPVVDPRGRPLGMIDITDIVGLNPAETSGGTEPKNRSDSESSSAATVPFPDPSQRGSA